MSIKTYIVCAGVILVFSDDIPKFDIRSYDAMCALFVAHQHRFKSRSLLPTFVMLQPRVCCH